jgi:hypothetical protein
MMLENILADFELLDDWEDRYRCRPLCHRCHSWGEIGAIEKRYG